MKQSQFQKLLDEHVKLTNAIEKLMSAREKVVAAMWEALKNERGNRVPLTNAKSKRAKRGGKPDVRGQVREALKDGAVHSLRDVMERTGLNPRQVGNALHNLRADGLVHHPGFDQWQLK